MPINVGLYNTCELIELGDNVVVTKPLDDAAVNVTGMTKAASAVDDPAARGKRLLASLQQCKEPSPEQQYSPEAGEVPVCVLEPLHDTMKCSVPEKGVSQITTLILGG